MLKGFKQFLLRGNVVGDLLFRRDADEHDHGKASKGRGGAGSHDQEMPGMPQRGADRGTPLRVLRAAARRRRCRFTLFADV